MERGMPTPRLMRAVQREAYLSGGYRGVHRSDLERLQYWEGQTVQEEHSQGLGFVDQHRARTFTPGGQGYAPGFNPPRRVSPAPTWSDLPIEIKRRAVDDPEVLSAVSQREHSQFPTVERAVREAYEEAAAAYGIKVQELPRYSRERLVAFLYRVLLRAARSLRASTTKFTLLRDRIRVTDGRPVAEMWLEGTALRYRVLETREGQLQSGIYRDVDLMLTVLLHLSRAMGVPLQREAA